MEEGILGVEELAGDRVVELRVVGLITCEWEGDVVAFVALAESRRLLVTE